MFRIAVLLFFFWSFLIGASGSTNPGESKTYTIKYFNTGISLDGIPDEEVWSLADSIRLLTNPWDSNRQDKTVFKSFYTEQMFCFSFSVFDTSVVVFDYLDESTVAREDRAELFFAPSRDMSKYYCIEIDPKGKKLDYEAQYYRKFDDRWNFEDIEISTRITSTGYTIEGCISIKELRKLGISDNFYLGVYRADYKSEKEEDVDWYSWIIPDSKDPDFHIPSALGKCFFQRKE